MEGLRGGGVIRPGVFLCNLYNFLPLSVSLCILPYFTFKEKIKLKIKIS